VMHILGCLNTPDAGEVWLRAVGVERPGRAGAHQGARHELGFIFQGFNLVPTLTVSTNVASRRSTPVALPEGGPDSRALLL